MTFNTSLSGNVEANLSWSFLNEIDLSTTKDQDRLRIELSLSDGSGDNQANEMWHDRRTLSPASPTDVLDLSGVLTNVFGRTIRFTSIKLIVVYNRGVPNADHSEWTPTDGEDVLVGGIGGSSDAASSIWNNNDDAEEVVRSGGMWFNFAPLTGHAVSPSAGDALQVILDGGGSNDVDYEILIIGVGEGA